MMPRHSVHLLLLLQQSLTSATLRAIHLLSRLLGLSAASGNPTEMRRLKCSRSWRLHGYLVFLFVLCYSSYAFYIVSTKMNFLRQNRLLLIVGCHRYALVLFAALLTLHRHTTRQRRIIALANRLFWCRRQLFELLHTSRLKESAREMHTRDHLTIYALGISIVCSSSYTLLILIHDRLSTPDSIYFWSLVFFYACQLCLQLGLALYLLAVLLISHLTHHCNLHLAQILADAVQVHDELLTRSLPSRQRLHDAQQHWLSLELWRLWRLHGQLMRLSCRLCSLHSIQLLAFVLLAPIECIMHSFFTYFVTFSSWWLRKFGKPAPFNCYSTTFAIAVFVQLALVIVEIHRQRQIFKATRLTLREGALALPPDCSKALWQTLHFYGLQLQLNERVFNLTACGLFELNKGLLIGIMQTIIIYTMILVQFDKIMYT